MPPVAVARPSLPVVARGLFVALRPAQWAKNLLVLAAPAAAGVLREPGVPADIAIAFVSFSLVSSAGYLVNDALDTAADRDHPRKRHRPVAAGIVSPRLALATAAALAVAGIAVAVPIRSGELAALVAAYLVVSVSYSLWLKRVAVVELAVVASGFVFRAVGGGIAVDVELSNWFLIVTSFGALFVVAGKRLAEKRDLGDAPSRRPVLDEYTLGFLNHVRTVAAGVTITAYCLWAFERADEVAHDVWFLLSVVPFVLAMLRYTLLVERGAGDAPEDLLLHDRVILSLGVLWAILFLVGVAAA